MKDKVTVFIHIPKTAGSSFRDIMRTDKETKKKYRPFHSKREWRTFTNKYLCRDCILPIPNFKFFSVHLPIDNSGTGTSGVITDLISNRKVYKKINLFTMLREPVQRLISEYEFIVYSDSAPLGFSSDAIRNNLKDRMHKHKLSNKKYSKSLSNYSWEQDSNSDNNWIGDWYETYGTDKVNPLLNVAEKRLPIFNLRDGVTYNEGENLLHWSAFYELDLYEYMKHPYTRNTQVKWLLGKQYLGDYEVTDKDYNTLIDTMEELNFNVGIKEQFNKSILYFNKLYKTNYSTESVPFLKKSHKEKPKLDIKQIKEIKKNNKYDVKLYKYFLDKFNAMGKL